MLENAYAAAVAGSLALSGGGSGLISVPSAQLMPLNTFEYQHSDGIFSAEEDSALGRRLAGVDRSATDHIQFSVVPRLEFGGRLTTWYTPDGRRTFNDLSGHLKLQLLDFKHFRLAAGARDFAGEATSLAPAEFVVADVSYGPFQLVAGYGQADQDGVALDGPFGGIQYSPFSWLNLLVDHDGVATQAGINLHFSYKRYSFFVKGYTTDNARQDGAFAAGVRIPLGRNDKLVPPQKELVWGLRKNHRASGVETRDALHATAASDGLARTYGQNVAAAQDRVCGKEVRYSAYNIPLMQLSCDEKYYSVSWSDTLHDANAVTPHLRLRLGPVQRYAVGTEVGRMDYSIALRPSLQVLLWDGLSAHVAYDIPLVETDDYEDGGAFERNAFESGVAEFAGQYTVHLWPGFFAQATGGQTRASQELVSFVRGDLAWLLFDGRLGLTYSYTDFKPEFTGVTESQSLGKAFLWIKPARYAAELTAGRFLYQDTGARLDLYKYFGRVRLGLYAKAGEDLTYAGMTVAVPLGGNSALGNRWISVAGTPHYEAFFETEVDSDNGRNLIRPNFLQEFHPQRNLLDDVLDQWRASPIYVRSR